MADKPVVIIHGWSDHSGSFVHLRDHLAGALQRPVETLRLADWLSLDDEVTYDDLTAELEREWTARKLPKRGRKTDVVLHSTGALVVRDWLVRFCDPKSPPIHRLLMLAPANFGSALAHHGASVAGRAKIGFQSAIGAKRNDIRRAFEPGKRLLDGLELGSSHTWDLAMRDRFDSKASFYGPGRILCTTLTGNEGNVLLAAEFDGSDGVVRTSNANMACARARIEFAAPPDRPGAPGYTGPRRADARPKRLADLPLNLESSTGVTAFRVVNGFRHGDIVLNDKTLSDKLKGERAGKDEKGNRPEIRVSELDALELMRQALSVTDENFDKPRTGWVQRCERATRVLTEALDRKRDDEVHGHLSLVVRVRNQFDQPIDDYYLEMWADEEVDARGAFTVPQDRSLTRLFQRHVLDDVHAYKADKSYRCFHIDCAAFFDRVVNKGGHCLTCGLSLSVTATPILDQRAWSPNGPRPTDPKKLAHWLRDGRTTGLRDQVGYYTLGPEDIARVHIPNKQLKSVFAPHRTILLDLQLERCQMPDVVRIRER